jgi:uncharacterized protein
VAIIPNSPDKIDAAEADYLYVQASQIANAGNGLFTAIAIYKNEIVSVFTGEILNDKQVKFRKDKQQDSYFINMLNGSILDSMHTPCFAKYANDAEGLGNGYDDCNDKKKCFKNNCIITLSDEDEICLVAINNIKVGEEIFVSYGNGYWQKKRALLNKTNI